MEEEKKVEEVKEEKKGLLNNTKQVSGKPLKIWLVVMIVIFMLITFGLGLYLGKQLYGKEEKKENNSVEQKNDESNKQIQKENRKTHNYGVNVNANPDSDFPDVTYLPVSVSDHGVTATLKKDLKTVSIIVNGQEANEYFNANLEDQVELDILFDKEIIEVFFGYFGQAVGGEKLLFLMKDGTVEYIPLYKVLNGKGNNELTNISSYGKIEGVSNVVALFQMEVQSFSGYSSVGARLQDGTFFDLSEFNIE